LIIKNKNKLKQKCEPVSSVQEGEKIATQLINELVESKGGVGLAANQIGINKRVCVVNVKEPVVLINPEITEKSEEMFTFQEGCLSFPSEFVITARHTWIKVKAEGHDGELYFTSEGSDQSNPESALECVCVQHEIDHLDGITMFDRKYRKAPIKRGVNAPIKIGRNDKVQIKKGEELKTIKWKKAESFMSDGWELHGLSS